MSPCCNCLAAAGGPPDTSLSSRRSSCSRRVMCALCRAMLSSRCACRGGGFPFFFTLVARPSISASNVSVCARAIYPVTAGRMRGCIRR